MTLDRGGQLLPGPLRHLQRARPHFQQSAHYPHSGELPSLEKEENSDTRSNLGEPGEIRPSEIPVTKGEILNGSTGWWLPGQGKETGQVV